MTVDTVIDKYDGKDRDSGGISMHIMGTILKFLAITSCSDGVVAMGEWHNTVHNTSAATHKLNGESGNTIHSFSLLHSRDRRSNSLKI